jgi:ATP-binding cassette, subfamily C (CFTR/MRP), member 10
MNQFFINKKNYYRWTSRELKRLNSISLTPVYSHFHETLGGISTIRAFRQVDRFIKESESHLNSFIRAAYTSNAASQWLNFRLQMMSVFMITAVGFTAVFQHIYSTSDPSLVGLALRYSLFDYFYSNNFKIIFNC